MFLGFNNNIVIMKNFVYLENEKNWWYDDGIQWFKINLQKRISFAYSSLILTESEDEYNFSPHLCLQPTIIKGF